MTPPESPVTVPGPRALRLLARAFAQFRDFDRFVAGLQAALDQTGALARLSIRVDRALADPSTQLSPGTLALPLVVPEGRLGTLQAAPGSAQQQFGPDDLHLLAGLADFLSVALGHALRVQENEQARELLRFLLNQAPVGLAAYTAERRLIVANDLAHRWLADGVPPFAELADGNGGFHVRSGGRLVYGEARRDPAAAGGAWLVVLHDLTPDQGRLLELVRRETYRALAQQGKFCFALVEGAGLRQGVLRRLPELRAALTLGETCGPYDANRAGLVFSGASGLALRVRLRKLRHVFEGVPGLRVGYAELGRHGHTPEELLRAAVERVGSYDDTVRAAVLVHDENPAVSETLAMLLGRDFHVVRSSEPARTRELLGRELFEGFLTELESRTGPDGAELMGYARARLPGIRPFFMTARNASPDWQRETGKEDAVVFEKPFDASLVTQTMRERLAD